MFLRQVFSYYRRQCRFYKSGSNENATENVITALRSKKSKSHRKDEINYFSDTKNIRTIGGRGGSGCISFLQLWCNERAGPDGGDGGNGGHVIFEASKDVRNLNHISTKLLGEDGQNGSSKECNGKSAKHTILKVPVGTVIRNKNGSIIGDLDREHLMFVAARGGAGGKGNRFFTTEKENSPKVSEHGPSGEDITYILEMKIMADIGLIGFPNAGKSTLLNAISRAHSKVASYAFTTLHPRLGVIEYSDHFQLTVADLPGIIPGSHRNKGLGIQFLKHVERCSALVYLIDASAECPWLHYENLILETTKFNKMLANYPKIVVANKMDNINAKKNFVELKNRINENVIGISAKDGTNLEKFLYNIRLIYDNKF